MCWEVLPSANPRCGWLPWASLCCRPRRASVPARRLRANRVAARQKGLSGTRRRVSSRIAQRIQDLFRCGPGLFRSVTGPVRCRAGASRTRGSLVRCRPEYDRVNLATSLAGWPCSHAVVGRPHASAGNSAAEVVQVGRGQGNNAGVWSSTGAARSGSIGTLTAATAKQAAVPAGKPRVAAKEGQPTADEGWVGAGNGKDVAEEARIAAKQATSAADLAWRRAAWGAMAAGRIRAPAGTGGDAAEQGRNAQVLEQIARVQVASGCCPGRRLSCQAFACSGMCWLACRQSPTGELEVTGSLTEADPER